MTDFKLVALEFALCAWCEFAQAQVQLRTDTIESARTEKESNLKPESPPKAGRDIEWIEHSLPYGAGPDSRKTGRSDHRLEDTHVEVRPGVWVHQGLRATAMGSFLAVNTGPGVAPEIDR